MRRPLLFTLVLPLALVGGPATAEPLAPAPVGRPAAAPAPPTGSTTPLPLPPKLVLGKAVYTPVPTPQDPLKSAARKAATAKALAGVASAGQTYAPKTPKGNRRTLRVVAARADLTGLFEAAWAVDAGEAVGADQCTQNLKLTAHTPAAVRTTTALCWRMTPTLSAYVLLIDPKAAVPPADAAAALDAVWAALSKGA